MRIFLKNDVPPMPTALGVALKNSDIEMVQLLLDHGVDTGTRKLNTIRNKEIRAMIRKYRRSNQR